MNEKDYKEIVTVRDLIYLLLNEDMSHQIILQDKEGRLVKDVTICTRKSDRVLKALFV